MNKEMGGLAAVLKPILQSSNSVVLELPEESYFDYTVSTVEYLQQQGYQGIFISFVHPYTNLVSLLQKRSVDVKDLIVIDSFLDYTSGVKEYEHKISISSKFGYSDFMSAVEQALHALKSKKWFVLVDAITVESLYRSDAEILKIVKSLQKIAQNGGGIIFLNVAKDITKKKVIQDISAIIGKTVSLYKIK